MDSREPPAAQPPPLPQPQHQQPLPQPQPQPQALPPGMMVSPSPQPTPPLSQPQPNSYDPTTTATMANNSTTNASPMITLHSAGFTMQNPRFPFNPAPPPAPKPLDSANYGDGSSPLRPCGFTMEPARKKRGRPRKYSPDNNISLALSPTPITPISSLPHDDRTGVTPSTEPQAKRRGRPPGSGKKQLDALGVAGVSFTPHVITVQAGEDIVSKIMAFSQQGLRTICILSANGAICNVTLRQAAMSGGTVTYEGRFEIISLSGSFLLSENNGNRSRTGGLSVSLAGPDGRVLGGGVAGMLLAATPVQIVVGSFIADGKKSKLGPSSAHPSNVLNFGASVVGANPSSQGTASESSDEKGGSPLSHGSGPYGNASQPIQNMPMYTNMGWPNSTLKILPN